MALIHRGRWITSVFLHCCVSDDDSFLCVICLCFISSVVTICIVYSQYSLNDMISSSNVLLLSFSITQMPITF
jgi:hypothetical protein